MCDGCDYEFEEAMLEQANGLHFATSLEREYDGRKHFFIFMVDDDGNIVVW